MRRIQVVIREVDDQTADPPKELATFDLPTADLAALNPQTALDNLEATTHETGNAILRRTLQAQWEVIDAALAEQYRQRFSPQPVQADGHASVKVASRFGTLHLNRQVFAPLREGTHVLPSNALLPPHQGMIITRALQELACLLPQDLSFESVTRLLSWQTLDAQVLSDTTVRNLVRTHGQIIRQAEQAEVAALLAHHDLTTLRPQLIPPQQPRRRAAWPVELTAAVDAALSAGATRRPAGVTAVDWERVLTVRRAEQVQTVEELRRLGPDVAPDQVLTTADEVLTRKLARRRFNELRTARLVTTEGSRYLSGAGDGFLSLLLVMVLLCAQRQRVVLLIADGARWIRNWFAALLALSPTSVMILDWFHLRKRCAELGSMICHGRKAKAALLGPLYRHLWQGEVDAAIAMLEAYRSQARNPDRLSELIAYLRDRRAYIPNYRVRRRESQYIGSAHVEKANDLIVAQRQKGAGMHWSLATSDALAALRTLMLNGGWDRYWRHREVLPLVAT